MKKILLCCAAGMSTSMLVKKMADYAEKNAIEVQIDAVSANDFEESIADYDCCLLGPQIKYKLAEFSKIAGQLNKRVDLIDQIDYGMMNGEKVLKKALSMLS
ncbi:PTS sugar transporter subunit IIB [Affinibrenneria salicis]|uniref:PTS sugar transporter subunit IIB n=1 Tax=Affinibrenneria salicis TaxID=2590031 RepID=A0A5J5G3J5_9GAMM|nr:PTS sugar transporter subunit IIB [Affinibrenneria salicis]KAA9001408.1 PTS sugar transporter subunit IIB [Affinibrenneria salicis]